MAGALISRMVCFNPALRSLPPPFPPSKKGEMAGALISPHGISPFSFLLSKLKLPLIYNDSYEETFTYPPHALWRIGDERPATWQTAEKKRNGYD